MELKPVEIQRWSWLASKLNEIIAAVNVLLKMQVSPTGAGTFQASEGNAVLTINGGSGGEVLELEVCNDAGILVTVKFLIEP